MANFINLAVNAATAQGKIAQRFSKITFTFTYTGSTVIATVLTALRAMTMKVTKFHDSYGQAEVWKDGYLFRRLEGMAHLQSAIKCVTGGGNTVVSATFLMVDEVTRGAITPRQNEFYQFDLAGINANVTLTADYIEHPSNAQFQYNSNFIFCGTDTPTPVSVAGAKLLLIKQSEFTAIELVGSDGKKRVLIDREIKDLMDDRRPAAYIKDGLVTPGGEEMYIIDVDDDVQANVTLNTNGKVEVFIPVPVK